jgi:hypothetical protein
MKEKAASPLLWLAPVRLAVASAGLVALCGVANAQMADTVFEGGQILTMAGDAPAYVGVGVDPVLWTPLKSFSGVSDAALSSCVSAGVPAADGRVRLIRANA